jgi:hypothetical protein
LLCWYYRQALSIDVLKLFTDAVLRVDRGN